MHLLVHFFPCCVAHLTHLRCFLSELLRPWGFSDGGEAAPPLSLPVLRGASPILFILSMMLWSIGILLKQKSNMLWFLC